MRWRTIFARLRTNAPAPRRVVHQSWGVYPKNASGDFYVEDGCCTLCGVPWNEAPDHFAVDEKQCYVKRQPADDVEVRKMIAAMHVSELGCIRYKGSSRSIIDAIRGNSDEWLIDEPSN
jgi:hypothetical protein